MSQSWRDRGPRGAPMPDQINVLIEIAQTPWSITSQIWANYEFGHFGSTGIVRTPVPWQCPRFKKRWTTDVAKMYLGGSTKWKLTKQFMNHIRISSVAIMSGGRRGELASVAIIVGDGATVGGRGDSPNWRHVYKKALSSFSCMLFRLFRLFMVLRLRAFRRQPLRVK